MADEPIPDLLAALSKLPLFQGLAATQVGRIIAVAEGRNVTAGEKICVNGTPKDEMFLLTAGELAILNGEGMRVATINAVATVGELSVIAGQAHSATIAVAQPGTLLTIKKGIFQQMLDGEPELKSAILQNVIQILASRLMQENVRMRDHVADKSSREHQIKELQQKLTVVTGILADRGISGPDLEAAINKKLSGGSPRVLVVDDDPAICSLFKISLRSFEVMTAENGKEALEFLQSQTVDLVITDIKMPEMDGFTLLTHLRNLKPELPVLATSGYVEADMVQGSGFTDFLPKPSSPEEIVNLVSKYLES